jgi:hypothetical protein
MKATESQQVNWLTVHRFVGAVLNQVNDWPMLGTPAWCSLAHDDPRKWCALLDGAQHWALRVDSCQEAKCEASRAVSAAGAPLAFTPYGFDPVWADWPTITREMFKRNSFRNAHPWAKGVTE